MHVVAHRDLEGHLDGSKVIYDALERGLAAAQVASGIVGFAHAIDGYLRSFYFDRCQHVDVFLG